MTAIELVDGINSRLSMFQNGQITLEELREYIMYSIAEVLREMNEHSQELEKKLEQLQYRIQLMIRDIGD